MACCDHHAGWADAPSCEDEGPTAEETVERIREFVEGFEARGEGLPLSTADQLWIMSLRKILDGEQ